MFHERALARLLHRPRLLASGVGVAVVLGGVVLIVVTVRWGAVGFAVAASTLAALSVIVLAGLALTGARWLRRRLRDADARLDRYLDERDRRLSVLERTVELLSREQADDAGGRAQELVAAGRLTDAADALEEAVGLRPRDRQLREAHVEVLREVHARGGAQQFLAAVEHQIAVGNVEHATALAEEAVVADDDSLAARDLLTSLLDVQGQTDRALRLALDTAARHVRQLDAMRREPSSHRELTPGQRTFVSGFFYSGSGAVVDHLRGIEGVVVWPPSGELRLVKFPGGFAELAGRHAETGELSPQDLLDLYLHLTGRKVTTAPTGSYDRWAVLNRNSRRLFRLGAPAAGYLAVCLASFLDLARRRGDGSLGTAELESFFRSWLQRALDAAATDTGADHIVVDQAVTAWRLDIARFVPPSNFVLVHRDPRDQFAEVREVLGQPGRSATRRSPSDFAARYHRDRDAAQRAIPLAERRDGHRVIQLSFEDFVVQHDAEATRLLTHLGLHDRRQVERRFRPEESRANVGKHQSMLSPAELDVLCRELAEYLHPPAGT